MSEPTKKSSARARPSSLHGLDLVVAQGAESAVGQEGSSDGELVQGALAGRQEAFAALVARYQRRAFWIAFHVVGQVETARDVVQEAFLRVHRSLPSFNFDRNFYTWFYRIVMNLAIDSLRRTKTSRALDLEEVQAFLVAGDGEEDPIDRNEVQVLVWQVLEHLDVKFRSVLVLRDIHGMSCREIVPILNVTHATVRWRLHRGRQLFREHWERLAQGWQE